MQHRPHFFFLLKDRSKFITPKRAVLLWTSFNTIIVKVGSSISKKKVHSSPARLGVRAIWTKWVLVDTPDNFCWSLGYIYIYMQFIKSWEEWHTLTHTIGQEAAQFKINVEIKFLWSLIALVSFIKKKSSNFNYFCLFLIRVNQSYYSQVFSIMLTVVFL